MNKLIFFEKSISRIKKGRLAAIKKSWSCDLCCSAVGERAMMVNKKLLRTDGSAQKKRKKKETSSALLCIEKGLEDNSDAL